MVSASYGKDPKSFDHFRLQFQAKTKILVTVTRKLPVISNGRMERLMCNFHLLAIIALQSSEQQIGANLEFSSNFGWGVLVILKIKVITSKSPREVSLLEQYTIHCENLACTLKKEILCNFLVQTLQCFLKKF